MSTRAFNKRVLDRLQPHHWERIEALIAAGGDLISNDVASKVGISLSEAMAFMLALDAAALADKYILVYHACSPVPVETRIWDDGLPQHPWCCPKCGVRVDVDNPYGLVTYAMMIRVNGPIDFV